MIDQQLERVRSLGSIAVLMGATSLRGTMVNVNVKRMH